MGIALRFESSTFFFDLLALSLLLLPCYLFLAHPLARRLLLTAAGIYLIYFIAPRLVPFYVVFWTAVFVAHRFAFEENGAGWRKALPAAGWAIAAVLALPMIWWKADQYGFIQDFTRFFNASLKIFSTKIWEIDMVKPLVAPVGMSFATFRAMDLLIKTYLGKLRGLRYDEVLFYGFFPPVQVVGPIIEFEEVARQDQSPTPADVVDALLRISLGIFKVFVLAGLLQNNADIFGAPHQWPAWQLWARLVGYSWFFYLNFSGYSDIAIGTALLYGFRLKENFSFPFFRRNIQEFWANWHMSLTRWAQRNIFVPAGGYRAHTQYRALFLTMMAIALWHNLNLSMLVFGLYHFGLQVVYRRQSARLRPAGISREPVAPAAPLWQQAGYALLTYTAVLVSFPLIATDFGKALAFYKALAGM